MTAVRLGKVSPLCSVCSPVATSGGVILSGLADRSQSMPKLVLAVDIEKLLGVV
jgi:hypothetical protein